MNVIRTAWPTRRHVHRRRQLALTLIALIAVVTLAVKSVWIGPLAGSLLLLAGRNALPLESAHRHARQRRRATRARSGAQQALAKRRGRPVLPHSVLERPGPAR